MRFHNDGTIEDLKKLKIELIREAISDLSIIIIKVFGESMLPTLTGDEKLMVEFVGSIEDLNLNDLIFFYDFNYTLALHRLIEINNEILILKGDNCENKDVINFRQVLGKLSTKNKMDFLVCRDYIKKTDQYSLSLRVEKSELVSVSLCTRSK